MTDKEKIKSEIERLKNKDFSGTYDARYALDRIIDFISSLPEEPVSEDLEEAAEKYAYEICPSIGVANTETELAFKAGANWQKQQMLAKTVDVEVNVDAGGYPYIPQLELYDYDKDVPLAKEGDKYKVVLIKEE